MKNLQIYISIKKIKENVFLLRNGKVIMTRNVHDKYAEMDLNSCAVSLGGFGFIQKKRFKRIFS